MKNKTSATPIKRESPMIFSAEIFKETLNKPVLNKECIAPTAPQSKPVRTIPRIAGQEIFSILKTHNERTAKPQSPRKRRTRWPAELIKETILGQERKKKPEVQV